MPADEAKIAELKSKFGEVHQLDAAGETIIVRMPKREEARKFRTQVKDENKADVALGNLLAACVVWPEAAQFEALLDRKPLLELTFGNELTRIAGYADRAEKKAL